jgi:heat shock protein HslJ
MRRKKQRRIAIAAFFLAAVAGCGGREDAAQTDSAESIAELEAAATASELAGTAWQLVKIMEMDDSTHVASDPSLYTLEFGVDGTAALRLDCNRGTGSWKSEQSGKLEFGPIAATSAECGPASLHARYGQEFQWVRSYVIEDGHLFLATMADGSIIEFQPAAEIPAAATVFGEAVRTDDFDVMRSTILSALFERYRASQSVTVEDSEIDAYIEKLDRRMQEDRNKHAMRLEEIASLLNGNGLTDERREKLVAEQEQVSQFLESLDSGAPANEEEARQIMEMRRDFARQALGQWKTNKALYDQYGGRIIFQQFGPEPIDAYRRFLEEQRDAGNFEILREEFDAPFWEYFTDDSMHDFFETGSSEEAEAFGTPPWN